MFRRSLVDIPMNFSQALHDLKAGRLVARAGWNGKGMFLYYVPGSTFNVNRAPLLGIFTRGTVIDYHAHIDMKTATGECVPWVASQTDILADDWDVVETSPKVDVPEREGRFILRSDSGEFYGGGWGVTTVQEDAFVFPHASRAENMVRNTQRFRSFKVVEL